MLAALDGDATRPCIAMVGAWDPLLPAHLRLLDRLRDTAHEQGMNAAVVVLHPDPVRFIWGVSELPVYDDVEGRIALIREAGIDAVARVRFLRRDLTATPEALLDALAERLPVAELWLGARQTLGRGAGGSYEGIQRVCEPRGIAVKRLLHEQLETIDVREALAEGRVRAAREVVGRPPRWGRPRSRRLQLAWKPGLYRAAALDGPLDELDGRPRLTVRLRANGNRLPVLDWPDKEARYLAFVAGPDD